MKPLKITVLGSGTSQGIPVIGCQCSVCKSNDSKDKRLRSSILFSWGEENFVIDTGPDFRQQMLREDIRSLRAVLLTHEHKDHIAGLDDVRSFNFLDKRSMNVYCTDQVLKALKREFYYVFETDKYPGVPDLSVKTIDSSEFRLPNGPKVIPIKYFHYKMPVTGYRIGNFAYLTDIKSINNEERIKLEKLDYLILDCLRFKKHVSHFNLEEALEFIDEIQAKNVFLTHISHLFDKHELIIKHLPSNVWPSYDGLQIDVGLAN